VPVQTAIELSYSRINLRRSNGLDMMQNLQIVSGGDGDEPESNPSRNPAFRDRIEARLRRRDVLAGGLSAAVVSIFGGLLSSSAARASRPESSLLGFKPVPVAAEDRIVVPPGYRVQVLLPWGEAIPGTMLQVGSHHDGLHYFPIDGSSQDGLFVMNHEYVEPRLMHASAAGKKLSSSGFILTDGKRDDAEVLREINAHGVTIARIRRDADGRWIAVADPRNRRVTGLTPMEIAGPVRGSALVRTKFSPDGTRTRGTLNNCGHGVTPWNTYMAAEENWAAYFRNGDTADGKPSLPREHARYGVSITRGRYGWELAAGGADEFVRFDVSRKGGDAQQDYRNEPNTFGWIVEIDPFRPDSVPVKRTALGRFAHEGVVFAPARESRPVVCYSADDAQFEYIYKFVSAAPYRRADAGGHLLDAGTLYAARFNDDGTGEWLPLAFGQGGLTPENGFHSQADVLVNTRSAADFVKATRMDRPEWGAVEPRIGRVYFTLTNNTRRQPDQVDRANPRARNEFGHIIRWTEDGGDHAATRFKWDLFIIAGPAGASRDPKGAALDADGMFACPDGLGFDNDGRLWIQTDIGERQQNTGALAPFGNNAMLCADPGTGEIRRFLTGPMGQEITGVVTTPDGRTMFVNVQHPGSTTSAEAFAQGRLDSHWPDGGAALPRSVTVVITKDDGGVIGT
jgi:secreted PhoX family phosphatase